jgi:hypothetical protein
MVLDGHKAAADAGVLDRCNDGVLVAAVDPAREVDARHLNLGHGVA